ncbi:MAG: LytTR family transcriptional regulator DNA-binding domain-containing protein, partial [Bacteroidia bacterium]
MSQAGGNTIISLVSGVKEFVGKPLSHFENLLPSDSFYRINRSQLVNVDMAESYNSTTGEVVLGPDKKMYVSTRKRSQFRRLFLNRS